MDLATILRSFTKQTVEQSKAWYQSLWRKTSTVNTESTAPKALEKFSVYSPTLVTSTEAAFRPYNQMIYELFYGQYPLYNPGGNYVSVPLTIIMFLLTKVLYGDASKIGRKKGGVVESGGRIGKLDSASEAGFFHKTNIENLKDLKDKPEDSDDEDEPEPKPKKK